MDMFQSKTAIIIMSIIWGLALGALCSFGCMSPNPQLKCREVEYRGPPITETKYYWRYGTDQCYRWVPYVTPC